MTTTNNNNNNNNNTNNSNNSNNTYSQQNSRLFYDYCKKNDRVKINSTLEALDQLRIDINAQFDGGCTSLFFASYHNNLELLKKLIGLGGDVNVQESNGGSSAFTVACVRGCVPIVDYLLGGARDDGVVLDPNAAVVGMVGACQYNHPQIVRRIIERGSIDVNIELDDQGATPLYIATETGNQDIVTLLLSMGADPDRARASYTPLHVACQFAQLPIIERLIKADANVNCKAKDGATPLLIASQNGVIKAVDMLAKAGADANIALTTDGSTALYVACARHHGNTVTALLDIPELDVNKTLTTDGNSSLHVMCQYGHFTMIKDLFEKFGNTLVFDSPNKNGATPLHLAARHGQFEICQFLIDKGANILATCDGDTPLTVATRYGRTDTIRVLKEAEEKLKQQQTK